MSQLGRDDLLVAYRTMATIREFEERLHDEIKTGRDRRVHPPVFRTGGRRGRRVRAPDRRGLDRLDASRPRPLHRQGLRRERHDEGDLTGAPTGCAKARAARCTSPTCRKGMLGANGIVGAGAPIAVGAALAAKLDGKGTVSIAFTGDGACNQGTTFEAMNLAVVLQAPGDLRFREQSLQRTHGRSSMRSAPARTSPAAPPAFGMKAVARRRLRFLRDVRNDARG